MSTIDLSPLMDSFEQNLERRAFSELRVQLELFGPLIRQAGGELESSRLDAIAADAAVGIQYELDHGSWSLLDRNHPVTLTMIADGSYGRIPQVTSQAL